MKNTALILAINTASLKTGVALLGRTQSRPDGGSSRSGKAISRITEHAAAKILAEKSWPGQSNEAEKLMPEIYAMLKSVGRKFSDIKEIYVVKGPGSFTGLRVGITVANTIAYLNSDASGGTPSGCKLFAVTTFEYWRALSPLPMLIYAGSGGVYLYHGKKTELVSLNDLTKILRAKKIKEVFGDITAEQKKILRNSAKSIKFTEFSRSFGRITEKIITSEKLKPVRIVEPLYIKSPGITISKKQVCYT